MRTLQLVDSCEPIRAQLMLSAHASTCPPSSPLTWSLWLRTAADRGGGLEPGQQRWHFRALAGTHRQEHRTRAPIILLFLLFLLLLADVDGEVELGSHVYCACRTADKLNYNKLGGASE